MGLDVYRDTENGRILVGHFAGPTTREATFAYDDTYLDWAMPKRQLGISENLPLDFDAYSPREYGAFMDGLLPESDTRAALSQKYQIPRGDYIALLAQLGCESIGALTFVANDTDVADYR